MGREIYLGEEWQLSSLKGKRHPWKGERVSDRIMYTDKKSAYEKRLSRTERESLIKECKVKKKYTTIRVHGFSKDELTPIKGIGLLHTR